MATWCIVDGDMNNLRVERNKHMTLSMMLLYKYSRIDDRYNFSFHLFFPPVLFGTFALEV
jgi:hypothetical protein